MKPLSGFRGRLRTREKRILIVDDDDAIRALLFTILRRRGFAADQARNGLEAMSRLRSCVYGAMLLDMMMPLKSGWDVLEELRAVPAASRPVVIVLTAVDGPRHFDPELVSGSLRKPFDVETLVETLTACVNTVGAREQPPGCPPADTGGHARPKIN